MLFPEAMMQAIADRDACRALLANGSRSFHAAAHLLPRRVRDPATALYAFCRLADDAVDLEAGPTVEGRQAALARLASRLDRAYRGAPLPMAADRAFAATVTTHAIPRAIPEALLEGLGWDAEGRRYETLADLHAYTVRVAGTVGVMMSLIMGVRDPDALASACSLGAAMQLTNIARDVGEDARAGRLYLPLSSMRAAGLDPDTWLAAPTFDAQIGSVVQQLLDEAERLYQAGETGIAKLPRSCRPGIRAARLLYAAIGHEVSRRDYNSVDARARVSNGRKLQLLLSAVTPRLGTKPCDVSGLAAGSFLIAAVCSKPAGGKPRASIPDKAAWVLELFERLEQRRHFGHST